MTMTRRTPIKKVGQEAIDKKVVQKQVDKKKNTFALRYSLLEAINLLNRTKPEHENDLSYFHAAAELTKLRDRMSRQADRVAKLMAAEKRKHCRLARPGS